MMYSSITSLFLKGMKGPTLAINSLTLFSFNKSFLTDIAVIMLYHIDMSLKGFAYYLCEPEQVSSERQNVAQNVMLIFRPKTHILVNLFIQTQE